MYHRTGHKSGTPVGNRNSTAQVTLEIALAFVCVFLLLLGTVKILVWVNERLILRQNDYEESRIKAGSSEPGVQVDESNYPELDIFGESS